MSDAHELKAWEVKPINPHDVKMENIKWANVMNTVNAGLLKTARAGLKDAVVNLFNSGMTDDAKQKLGAAQSELAEVLHIGGHENAYDAHGETDPHPMRIGRCSSLRAFQVANEDTAAIINKVLEVHREQNAARSPV